MRILFVSQIVPYPPHGGVLQRGFNLVRELGRRHEVHLLAFHHPDELRTVEAVAESQRVLGEFCASVSYFPLWPKRSRVHLYAGLLAALPYPLPFSVLAHRCRDLSTQIEAICHGSSRPDIVHLDTIALAPYGICCGQVPVVMTHHNIESRLMFRRAEVERGFLGRAYVGLQARRLAAYETRQATRFPLNIMVSEHDAAVLHAMAPGVHTAVIPNGVDLDYFAPRPGEETPALIYTGGMNMFANRDAVEWFLAEIWPRVKTAVPGVRFYAIGQDPSPAVQRAAREDGAVEAPGFVADIRPWVAKSAVYVVPLRVGGGTRLKMVDAMAQGKAIVATRVGAEGIRGDHGEHFLLADDPTQFAQEVIALLHDDARRARLGRSARARVEEVYAWRLLGEQLVQLYAQVASEHRR